MLVRIYITGYITSYLFSMEGFCLLGVLEVFLGVLFCDPKSAF